MIVMVRNASEAYRPPEFSGVFYFIGGSEQSEAHPGIFSGDQNRVLCTPKLKALPEFGRALHSIENSYLVISLINFTSLESYGCPFLRNTS